MRIRSVDLRALSPSERARLTRRTALPDQELRDTAATIVAAVRDGGEAALRAMSERYGGSPRSGRLRVPASRIEAATARLDAATATALRKARDAITACHLPQIPHDHEVEPVPGVRVARRWSPLRRVAVYVPGGRAAYPSSLLMGAIPAQIAGVREIVVATPVDENGEIAATVLAAAGMLGLEEIYGIGGAQAVAALAYGTASIPRVDKIVGPGNAWVTAAKLAVVGDVGIDLPAGPSEALILTDGTTSPRIVAADLICQAEHGPDSVVVLVTTDSASVPAVLAAVDALLPGLDREPTISKALADHGLIVAAPDIDQALDFAEAFAPEHLTIHTSAAREHAAAVTAAGSVFVGEWAPESAGDYATGANHVLPTGGLATSHGPLGVEDFGSWRQVQTLTRSGLSNVRSTVGALADAEGLSAHKLAVEVRFETEAMA